MTCALLVAAPQAGGQAKANAHGSVVLVSVADAANGAFIEHAQVQLPEVRRAAVTDWRGEAHVDALPRGAYRIDVRALGYSASSIQLSVREDTVWVLFQLQRVPVRLDSVRVMATTPVSPQLAEYEQRRRMGIGRFLPESLLARNGDQRLSIVLATRIPGLLAGTRGLVALDPSGISGGGLGCGVNMYLDGFLIADLSSTLDEIRPRDLAGIEVYSRASAPPAYRPTGNYCRVILLWTKWW